MLLPGASHQKVEIVRESRLGVLNHGIAPTTRYLTSLALKRLNRSVKSELTNIDPFDLGAMDDQIPSGIESRLRRLGLPELDVERSIKILKPSVALDDVLAHVSSIAERQSGRRLIHVAWVVVSRNIRRIGIWVGLTR